MDKVSEEVLKEIQKKAKDYMTSAKGKNVTDKDILIAENLIMFGYLKAKNEKEIKENDISKAHAALNLLTEPFY